MCTKTDSDWYLRMPASPHLVELKVEILLQLSKEEGDFLGPIFHMKDN